MNVEPTKPVRKYLAVGAEPEAALAPGISGSWRDVVAIPASREDASLLDGLRPAVGPDTLVIVVVNGRENARPGVPNMWGSQALKPASATSSAKRATSGVMPGISCMMTTAGPLPLR